MQLSVVELLLPLLFLSLFLQTWLVLEEEVAVFVCCGIVTFVVVVGELVVVNVLVGAIVVYLVVSADVVGPVLLEEDVVLDKIGKVRDIMVWIVVIMGVVKMSGVVSFGIVTSFVVGLLVVVVSTILVGVELVSPVVSADVLGPVLVEEDVDRYKIGFF